MGFVVTRNLHHSYRSIPEHCDLQTDISNCLGYIIACPQIDLTLPCCSSLPLHTIVTDQFVPKETQKIAGLQLFRTQNICNGLTGDVLKIVLILCTWQKYETYLACKEWLVSATVKKCFIGFEINTADTDHDKLQCILLEFQGENTRGVSWLFEQICNCRISFISYYI